MLEVKHLPNTFARSIEPRSGSPFGPGGNGAFKSFSFLFDKMRYVVKIEAIDNVPKVVCWRIVKCGKFSVIFFIKLEIKSIYNIESVNIIS